MKRLVNYFKAEGKKFSFQTQCLFSTFCHQVDSGDVEARLLPRETIIYNLERKTVRSSYEGTYSE